MSKSKEKALNLARQARKGVKKYARGGEIDINDTFDPTEGGNIPRSIQQKVRQLPKTWTPPNAPPVRSQTPEEDLHNFINRYAEGGDVDDRDLPLADPSFKERWYDRAAGAYAAPKQNPFLFRALFDEGKSRNPYQSDLAKAAEARAFGELKGTAPEDTPTTTRLKGGMRITEGDAARAEELAGGFGGGGIFVGPYGAHMLRGIGQAGAKPHPVYAKDVQAAARKLPEAEREAFIRDQVEYRDDLARRALEKLHPEDTDDPIWRASGWSRGPAGEPTKEIPDLGAKLVKIPGTDKYELVHPAGDLHKLYEFPPIRHDPSLTERGHHAVVAPDNTISVANPKRVTDVLHEVQHVIDRKEGGARPPTIGDRTKRPEFMEQELYETARNPFNPERKTYALPEWQYLRQKELMEKSGKEAPSKEHLDMIGIPEKVARGLASDEVYMRAAGEVKPRNVQNRFEHGFNYQLHPELTEDVGRGVQWVDKSLMPRSREEVLSQIRNSYIRKSRRPWENVLDDAMDPKNDAPRKAGGGGVGNFNPERASAYGLARQGMIKSNIPGRTDKINMKVPTGSYIIPADIPSAIGEGNSDAGGAILGKMLQKGPYGMNLPRRKANMRIGKRKASLSMSFAEGGQADHMPIVAAGGEFVVYPENVAHLGGGDIDLGHAILDDFVKQIREKNINTLKGLKPPKGSE